MTKKDLVQQLAASRGIKPREARAFIDAFLGTIEKALTEGRTVTLRSFGRFEVRKRAGRRVTVPRSGLEMALPAHLVPAFHGARAFEERVAAGRTTAKPGTL